MNNIYLLYNFNNYYNRQLKRYATLAEYKTAVSNNYIYVANVLNFTPNDGVDTKHIFNVSALNVAAGTPDYMLVVDDSDVIQSRWFVIDTERTRGQQYVYHLYRDTVAEAWDSLQSAPVFVEKGILGDFDPMIFNSENMSFNRIKSDEWTLKDETECAWIVGYLTQTALASENYSFLPSVNPDYSYANISQYTYNEYATGSKMNGDFTDARFIQEVQYTAQNLKHWDLNMSVSNLVISVVNSPTLGNLYASDNSLVNAYSQTLLGQYNSIHSAVSRDLSVSKALQNENGKIIYESSSGKYYKVVLDTLSETVQKTYMPTSSIGYGAFKTASQVANSAAHFIHDVSDPNAATFYYRGTLIKHFIHYAEIPSVGAVTYKLANARRNLNNQPYSMFCMPYGKTEIDHFDGAAVQDWSEISMSVAKDISKNLSGSSAALYDLQLLPYCPIREYLVNSILDINGKTEDVDYSYIVQNSVNKGIIFWCTRSDASFKITSPVPIEYNSRKLDNELNVHRICSPNYSGQFEFSASKNGGVQFIHVDFTYKPYNPYIHLNPDFDLMYGRDFGDARGLVCGGKFDLPQASDAWAAYERNNSNYELIFNRQITNLEISNSYAKKADIWGAVAGTMQGTISGAMAGSNAGPWGAAIGAAVGGTVSAAAGVADVRISDELRKETLDYTKDMYSYNLGTIQAMPDSLVSVGALTKNNKIFPFVETYRATDKELEALKNKIRFNGMSVGRIGTISEFSVNIWTYSNGWNYFKGKLIRLELDGEDWHFINTIKSELDRGIFIKQEA